MTQNPLIKSIDKSSKASKSSDKLEKNMSDSLIQLLGKEEKAKTNKNWRTLSLLSGHEKEKISK